MPRPLHGLLIHASHASRVLEDNKLGDTAKRDLYTYLPPSYDETKRYPTVLLLAAFGGDARSFLDGNPFKLSVIDRIDALMASGECAPAIVAMPDATTRWGGSQYLDSPATGRYQTYLADEVFPFLDATFRTIPDATGRAVAGRSSGGFGALRLAIDRQDVVSALASHAGDAAFDLSLRPSLLAAAVCIAKFGSPEAFLESLRVYGPTADIEHEAIFAVAALAAYESGTHETFPHFAWPFDLCTGQIDPEGFARIASHDPIARLARERSGLGSLQFAFIDAGSGDEHGLGFGAKELASQLIRLGIAVHHELHEGGHRGTRYRLVESIPAMLSALSALR